MSTKTDKHKPPDRQHQMLKRGFDLTRDVIHTLRRTFLSLFLTTSFYRLIAFTILAPLVSAYTGLFFKGSGRLVIANEEIANFLLQPIGLLALVIIAACSLTLVALEQACLMTLLTLHDSKDTIARVVRVFRYILKRAVSIHKLALRIVFRILVISAPFIVLAGLLYFALLRDHDINYYLTNRPPEFILAAIGIAILLSCLAVVLIRYTVRVLFSLPILLFEEKKPSEALRESHIRSEHRRLSIALAIAAWGLIMLSISGLSTAAFFWVGRLSVPLLIGHKMYMVPAIGFWFLGFTLCQFLISMVAAASFSMLIMIRYDTQIAGLEELDSRREDNSTDSYHRKVVLTGRVVVIGVLVAFIAAAVTGWFLLSRADFKDSTQIVAHRGASGSAPENTMAAVKQAIADGAHWVEIDVQRTADDRVVVIHDQDLMRIGNTALVVTRTPYARLAQVDVGSWFHPRFSDQRIPTLEAVLEECKGKINVNIELKYYGWDPHLAGQVIAIVESARMEDGIVLMSLKPEAVEQVKRERPDWQVGLLAAAALTDLTRVVADFLAVHSRMATPGFVRRVHRRGKTIQVWTVNDPVGMTKMFGMGVDALITDEPRRAADLLAQRAEMEPVERMLVTAGLLIMGDQTHEDPSRDGF